MTILANKDRIITNIIIIVQYVTFMQLSRNIQLILIFVQIRKK